MAEDEKNLNQATNDEVEDIFGDIEEPSSSQPVKGNQEKTTVPPSVTQVTFKKKKDWKKLIRPGILVIVIIIFGFFVFYGQTKLREFFRSSPAILESTAGPQIQEEAVTTTSSPVVTPFESAALDSDGDGLLDSEEDELGTDKNNPDSDGDGLFDKEEVKIYLTNPLKADTDQDGISDGQEVKQGKDPNNPDQGALLLDIQEEINKLNQ
ncbi:hypothetical protein IID20_03295 [Patescibacteria group bacterium]|nr:hypothetical protein [Patescibacteria group bacterium]